MHCANAQASMQQLKFTAAFTRQNQILSVCAVRDRVIFGSWLSRHFSHYSIDMRAVRPAFHTITLFAASARKLRGAPQFDDDLRVRETAACHNCSNSQAP